MNSVRTTRPAAPLRPSAVVLLMPKSAGIASPGPEFSAIAPETFSQLQRSLVDFGRGVLTTEFEGDAMTAVSLTLTPKSNSQLSSFAGLGLT